ncbi:MAG: sigma-70 family RNA polymerase sigma factor [Polyangiaceae bacterium]|nr:sigma-70 family RNA polymerase sigma factor [Polyangiaceae bacterium]
MTDAAPHHELVSAAAGGDDRALSTLVRLYHDRVYRFGLRACRDGFDADDAVQDAFIALSRRPDVAADPGVLSWLMTSVRRACMKMLRPFLRERRRLGERGDAEAIESDALLPDAAMERWELVSQVHAAIATLDAPSREVLVLRDIEGLSGKETCAALQIEEAAMKSRLHRAREMLAQKITRTSTSSRRR